MVACWDDDGKFQNAFPSLKGVCWTYVYWEEVGPVHNMEQAKAQH